MSFLKKLVSTISAVALASISSIALSSPAYAASGSVMCSYVPVVGMWIEVEKGKSGWAWMSGSNTDGSHYRNWSYDTQGKRWRAHVGCDGTPEKWGRNLKSNWTTGNANLTCHYAYFNADKACQFT